jgi:hypothetical protein
MPTSLRSSALRGHLETLAQVSDASARHHSSRVVAVFTGLGHPRAGQGLTIFETTATLWTMTSVGEPEQVVDSRRARRRLRYWELGWILLCLFFAGYGTSLVWKSERSLPGAYATLRSRGAPATAHLVRCALGIGGGRGMGCRISLDYQGYTRSWDYPEDSDQFDGLQPGAPITVLVDPHNPKTVYTVHDVDRRTNAGTSSPVVWYGVVLITLGLAGFSGFLWIVRPRRRPRLSAT